MTIANRDANQRLSNLEQCAQEAPEGTYQLAKDVVALIEEASRDLMKNLKALGLKAPGDDRLRNLEVATFGYIADCNPEAYSLITGEAFGEHIQGPARERVMAGCIRDRDFLRGLGLAK